MSPTGHHRPATLWLCATALLWMAAGCGTATGPGDASVGTGAVSLTPIEVLWQRDGTPGVLLLQAAGSPVFVPVTDCESEVIAMKLQAETFWRPLFPDLFSSIADSLGYTGLQVSLGLTESDSLAAAISLTGPDGVVSLWATPGDALAIAVTLSLDVAASPEAVASHLVGAVPVDSVGKTVPGDGYLHRPEMAAPRLARQSQTDPQMVEARILSVLVGLRGGASLLLSDARETFILPITVGACQALPIYESLHGVDLRRVQSPELMRRLLDAAGADMAFARILSLEGNTFLGEIGLVHEGRRLAIDARPSDAIALAMLSGAAIHIHPALVEAYGRDRSEYDWILGERPADPSGG